MTSIRWGFKEEKEEEEEEEATLEGIENSF
jgi:hypothetical protein